MSSPIFTMNVACPICGFEAGADLVPKGEPLTDETLASLRARVAELERELDDEKANRDRTASLNNAQLRQANQALEEELAESEKAHANLATEYLADQDRHRTLIQQLRLRNEESEKMLRRLCESLRIYHHGYDGPESYSQEHDEAEVYLRTLAGPSEPGGRPVTPAHYCPEFDTQCLECQRVENEALQAAIKDYERRVRLMQASDRMNEAHGETFLRLRISELEESLAAARARIAELEMHVEDLEDAIRLRPVVEEFEAALAKSKEPKDV